MLTPSLVSIKDDLSSYIRLHSFVRADSANAVERHVYSYSTEGLPTPSSG